MFEEKRSFDNLDRERLAIQTKSAEIPSVRMTGDCLDRIYKNGVLIDEIHDHNIVVNSFLNLVMLLMKHDPHTVGIQYWAVGAGSELWQKGEIPEPLITETKLVDEIGRKKIELKDMRFLDSDFNVIGVPSNILEIRTTFDENDCNGPWREFGLFGGNATEAPDSGVMINKRNHSIITKTEEMIVERVLRFTLTLV